MRIKRSLSIFGMILFFCLAINLTLLAQSKNNHQRNILSKPIDPWTSAQVRVMSPGGFTKDACGAGGMDIFSIA